MRSNMTSVGRATLVRQPLNILMPQGPLVGARLPTVGSSCNARPLRYFSVQ